MRFSDVSELEIRGQEHSAALVLVHALIVRRNREIICKASHLFAIRTRRDEVADHQDLPRACLPTSSGRVCAEMALGRLAC